MKKLDFDQFGENKNKVFSIIWLAYRAVYPKHAAGFEQMKICNRIGENLELISKESPTPQDQMERTLTQDVLLLSSVEFSKLQAMLKSEEIGWTHSIGRFVEITINAFENAPEVEVEEKKKLSKVD